MELVNIRQKQDMFFQKTEGIKKVLNIKIKIKNSRHKLNNTQLKNWYIELNRLPRMQIREEIKRWNIGPGS